MHFHLALIMPHPKMHIVHGYREIIDAVGWGLTQLGHTVTHDVNTISRQGVNILFGTQMLELPALRALPENSIVYNLEQNAGHDPRYMRDSVRYYAEHFTVWEYSEFNMPSWKALNPDADVKLVPIGYAPVLSRVTRPEQQDIEVLFYGGPGGDRLEVYAELCRRLVKTVFVHGLYGASRDSLIARSKIVLNLNQYAVSDIFAIARVSYLLANRKAVVSDFTESTRIEADIRDAVRLSPREGIVEECLRLLDNPAELAGLEEKGFEIMRRRDIRASLAAALGQ